jgi:CheY-like chemotaxis protein
MGERKQKHRMLLRAELEHEGRSSIGHTMEISESLVFVQTERTAYIGDRVIIRLSFPGLIEPFSLETQVVAQRLASGPGSPGGWTLGFVYYSEAQKKKLRELLRQAESSRSATTNGPYNVLLVDDNSLTRDVFSYGVQQFFDDRESAVKLDVTASGESAWQMLQSGAYDLAIVDFFLPTLTGAQLIERVRQEPNLERLPVMVISAGGPEARDASIAAGADLFLHKPVVLRDLFSTLDQLMRFRQQREASN